MNIDQLKEFVRTTDERYITILQTFIHVAVDQKSDYVGYDNIIQNNSDKITFVLNHDTFAVELPIGINREGVVKRIQLFHDNLFKEYEEVSNVNYTIKLVRINDEYIK